MSLHNIIPITRLKNEAAELVRRVNEDRCTLVVTQNGAAKVVIMDAQEFDELQETLALLKIVAQGEADIEAQQTCSLDEAFDDAHKAIDGRNA